MSSEKETARKRRAVRTRKLQQRANDHAKVPRVRLMVYRSNRHIYVQAYDSLNNVVGSASTVEVEVRKQLQATSNVNAAQMIGQRIAKKLIDKGIEQVSFDRNGYKYIGRIEALAHSARESGLKF